MPNPPKTRVNLDTIEGLGAAIERLPSDPEVPKGTQGYNRYTTQRAHWLGWLNVTPGTGSYERKTPAGCGAKGVYNRIVEPKMLLWLIEASKVDAVLVSQAKRAHRLRARWVASPRQSGRPCRIPWSRTRCGATVPSNLAAAVRRSGLRCEGINVFVADGEAAMQDVFHVHLHVIPRFVGDGFGLVLPPEYANRPPRSELEDAAARIRSGSEAFAP